MGESRRDKCLDAVVVRTRKGVRQNGWVADPVRWKRSGLAQCEQAADRNPDIWTGDTGAEKREVHAHRVSGARSFIRDRIDEKVEEKRFGRRA